MTSSTANTNAQPGTAIEFEAVSKQYKKTLPLLDSVSFSMNYGQVVALVGPSGSGKSTILQIAAALTSPDSGRVKIDGKQVFPSSKSVDLSKLRSSMISYVSQDDFLFESLSVAENVLLALELNSTGSSLEEKLSRVDSALDTLGIKRLADRQISDVSAGERRRVAIGRGLVTNPKILIADEPTSSLDLEATNDFLKLIRTRADGQQMAFLLASHDVLELKTVADSIYAIKNHVLVKVEG